MPTSPEARSHAIEFTTGMPILYDSGLLSISAGGAAQGVAQVAPWDMVIKKAWIFMVAATTATNLTLDIGTTAAPTGNLSAYAMAAANHPAGSLKEIPLSSFASLNISKGTRIRAEFNTADVGDGTGHIILALQARTDS